ncbi:hypothetical protein KP509_38G034900 [Ceratopteris richardii]|uniref:Uncharacterized protein n=1 Tax=Ceratopteris richardii TaxID=49495 RepID=A0A8T2Q4J3_CERRI|nr:hypothetical protein KP509_38G034900 [Ceratopteris richardii]KAH7278301.1 hypothetical protein KP509_38G034900 [Ceratopteris richardii]
MEAFLIDCIMSSLHVYMYRNAIFLCERLYAEFPSENNLHLLATCYFRNNQAHRVYHILKGEKSAQLRYLFALACYEMGNLAEAEAALLHLGESGAEVPHGAAGYYLLGLICRHTDRRQAAITHYTQALSLDLFFWSAYEELCTLGAEDEAAALYGDLAIFHLQRQQLHWDTQSQHASQIDMIDSPTSSKPSRSPYANDASPKQSRLHANNDMGVNSVSTSGINTPASGGISLYTTPSPGPSQIPAGPPALNRTAHGVFGSSTGGSGASSYLPSQIGELSPRGVHAPAQQQRRKVMDEGKLKKVSGRLFAEPVPRRSTRLSSDSSSGAVQQNSSMGGALLGLSTGNGMGHSTSGASGLSGPVTRGGNATVLRSSASRRSTVGLSENIYDNGRKIAETPEDPGNDETLRRVYAGGTEEDPISRSRAINIISSKGRRSMEGALEILSLLRLLGEAYKHLCMYRCQEALQAFSKLSQQQYATGWVLIQVGKAYFEMVNYPEAVRAFSWARHVSPYRLEGMDVYSTVLYHMKKDVELSYLAQETIAIDRLSPQAWCVMGNCCSLQKDHEAALKYFQRALQLDQYFTYAHTLCGHEYVAMEDFKEGISCYRQAIRIDPRHYNAWYGLGTIYFRQEKFEFAEYHFQQALLINNRSSVLLCYLGIALHALKKNGDALSLLEQAVLADPKNPLPKYQKANVLVSEERYEDALKELEYLKEVAPRESSVFFLMGRIYKRLNMPEQAMHHFCIALDLKPSSADVNLIKSAIEKLNVPDDLEEDNL